MNEMMIFTMLGLLESGKTTLIKEVLQEEVAQMGGKTLVLVCEEGEEEFDQKQLAQTGAVAEYIEDEESFRIDVVKKFMKKHRPDQIVIEYNGMWKVERIYDLYEGIEELLFDRQVMMQVIDVVDDTTFSVFVKNMGPIMVEQFKAADLIIVNRCTVEKTNKLAVRGTIKAVNPRAQIAYESEDEAFYQMPEQLPYDINAEIIEIADEDFGLWHIDMIDHQENYEGKTVKVKGLIRKSPKLSAQQAVFGRHAMTCCADDVQFMGFLCYTDDFSRIPDNSYVTITARIEFKYMKEYGDVGPVFFADEVLPAEKPADEMVYFN